MWVPAPWTPCQGLPLTLPSQNSTPNAGGPTSPTKGSPGGSTAGSGKSSEPNRKRFITRRQANRPEAPTRKTLPGPKPNKQTKKQRGFRAKPTASLDQPKPAPLVSVNDLLASSWKANPTPAPANHGFSTNKKRWLLLAGAGVAIAATVGWLRPHGPSYPKQWDLRVSKLAAQTAKLRGLPFKHPVYIRFLDDVAFDRNDSPDVRSSDPIWKSGYASNEDSTFQCYRASIGENHPPCQWNVSKEDDDVDPVVSVFRALGLATSGDDASGLPLQIWNGPRTQTSLNSIEGALVLARYDDVHKVIEVRGTSVSGKEPTIVHEMVHALHDQNFSMKWPKETEQILAFRSLLEGDARRIENDFVDSEDLSPAQKLAREKANEEIDKQADKRVETAIRKSGIEDSVVEIQLRRSNFPYDEGEYFVRKLLQKKGQAALDAAFAHPPRSSAEIVYPPVFLSGGVSNPAPPDLLNTQNAYSTKTLRLGLWYAMEALWAAKLDNRVGDVVRSWHGDGLVVYEDTATKRVCFATDISLRGPKRDQALETLAALAIHVHGTFKTNPSGGTFTACDLTRELIG